VPEPRACEVEMAIEKLKSHKSPGIDKIPAELTKVVGRTIRSDVYIITYKLISSSWNKKKLPEEWKELITVPTYKNSDKVDSTSR
jgi:hypothetical protein